MCSRFTALFLFSTLACASCAALVAMLLVANPPVVHMSRELAMEQLSLIGLGLLVMFFLILSLVVLMRMRRRVKQIHQVLAKYSHAHLGERVLNVSAGDDLGMLEYRVNRLLDIVDVFVRDKHAAISEEKDEEYYHSVVNTPLSSALQEIKAHLAFDYAESSMDKHLKSPPATSMVEYAPVEMVLDEDVSKEGETLAEMSEISDIEELPELDEDAPKEAALFDAEIEDFAFDSLEEDSASQQASVMPAAIEKHTIPEEYIAFEDAPEEVLERVAAKEVEEIAEEMVDDFLASLTKFSALSSYMRDALEKFYDKVRDYGEEVGMRQRAHEKTQQKLKKEITIVSSSHAHLKRDLTKVLDALPKDDSEVWKSHDDISPEDVLRKGIEQVAVMAKQVRMYTLGAMAQAEKHEGMGEGFKQAAQEIRDLANESGEAAKLMDEALKAFEDKSDTVQQERAAMHGLTDVLYRIVSALPDAAYSPDDTVDTQEGGAPLTQLEEMMTVLRAATDAMKDESKELAERLKGDTAQAA